MLEGAPGDMVGRGDLEGGRDLERNAQISALKKLFYQSPDVQGEDAKHEAANPLPSLLGVMEDMPLCRWDQIVMLPGYNVSFQRVLLLNMQTFVSSYHVSRSASCCDKLNFINMRQVCMEI